jgi:hypothetical protein
MSTLTETRRAASQAQPGRVFFFARLAISPIFPQLTADYITGRQPGWAVTTKESAALHERAGDAAILFDGMMYAFDKSACRYEIRKPPPPRHVRILVGKSINRHAPKR